MKYFTLIFVLICLFTNNDQLFAQRDFGKLKSTVPCTQEIEFSTYHQYELKLKKGTIVLLKLTEVDVRTELTIVNSDDIILEKVNTSETADFLIFESTKDGNYQFYINLIDEEKKQGTYTLTAQFITNDGEEKLNQIKQLIQLLETPQPAGAAIAILENEKVIFDHYYGFSNVENQVKNNKETVFELASVSKQFTAMAIAKLAEQNKLSVEDDIRKHFPELPIYKTPIKIKNLLNHSAGIIDSEYPLALAGFEKDPIEINRVLNFLKNTPEQYFETGSDFSYCNDCYTLLGELVNRITKQTFNNWMKENVFDPLEMNSTIIRDSPEILIPNRATSYITDYGESNLRRLSFDFLAPGGCSVRSSISDLVKWVNYLNQGYHSEEKLFQRINQLETFNNGNVMQYAYGNFITNFRGLERISHLGLSAGFRTSIARFPEKNLSFIFLANDGEFPNYYLARKIYEIYLEEHLLDKTKVFEGIQKYELTTQDEKNAHTIFQGLNLSDYEGTYFSQQINSTYTFKVIKDTLFAISAAYKPIPIIGGTKDTLKTDEDFMETLVYKRDFDGNVSDISVYNDSDDYAITFMKISIPKQWPKTNYWDSDVFKQKMHDTLQLIEATKLLSGFGVSVFDDTEIIFQKGYGYADIADQKPYKPETIQLIASISKSVTGMAIMKAMEMGYFKLDDPINDYLPFKITNPKFSDTDITIRHLLTHTSTLNDNKSYNRAYVFKEPLKKEEWPKIYHSSLEEHNNNEKLPLSEFLDEVFSTNGKLYVESEMFTKERPGTNYKYSNFGFALLGYIIELTTKEDFRDFTKKHIFDPLGMNQSTWDLENVDPKNHATYYLGNEDLCPKYTCNTIPDGGLYTNVIDLTKFLQEAMHGYLGQGKILSQSSYREMFRSQSDLFEIESGLGWDLSISCCIGHSGNDFGVSTVMYFQPSSGIGRIVFSNSSIETDELESTFYGIMNLLFLEDISNGSN